MLDSLKWWKIDKCQYMNVIYSLSSFGSSCYSVEDLFISSTRVSAPSSEILAVSRLDGGTTATYFYIINIVCAT